MSDEADVSATFTMTLGGREIMFKRAILGQVLILERLYHRAMKRAKDLGDADNGRELTGVVMKTLDFIDTLVIDPDDRQFIEDEMLAGTIDWEEVLGALGGGKKETVEDDEAPKAIKRKPATKAAAAKKVASRARTKR